jgi:spore maturation protein B
MCIILAIKKKKSPFETFLEGAKEGLVLFKGIFASLLAMLVAINLLKASGFIDDLGNLLSYVIPNSDFYAKLTPMILFRPLSGSASLSVLQSVCVSEGPDSLICKTSSVIQASSDTTFYIITLYYSSIGVTKWRHSVASGLMTDLFGFISGIILSLLILTLV